MPAAARGGQPRADPDADGARRRRRPHRRPRRGRRRLPREAVRRRRAEGAPARAAAPQQRRGRSRCALVRRAQAGQRPPRGDGRRRLRRADAHRVPAARAAHAQPPPRAAARPDLRPRVGLRLRPRVERAARLRRIPAPQARGHGRAATSSTPCAVSATSCASREPAHAHGGGGGRRGRAHGRRAGRDGVRGGALDAARSDRQLAARPRADARRPSRGRAGPWRAPTTTITAAAAESVRRRRRQAAVRLAGRDDHPHGTTTAATRLPVDGRTRALAASGDGALLQRRDACNGVHLRVLTVGRGPERRGADRPAADRGRSRSAAIAADPARRSAASASWSPPCSVASWRARRWRLSRASPAAPRR